MAIVEDACWTILKTPFNKARVFGRHYPKSPELDFEVKVNHGMMVTEIEKILVLTYTRSAIDDSLYFLEKRGYILIEDLDIHNRRHHYSLTESALTALQDGHFSDEEQKAFEDALLDLKTPGMFGVKINLGEMWRRAKKSFKKNRRIN